MHFGPPGRVGQVSSRQEDEMRYLLRSAVVLVFVASLLSALPAQAAPAAPANRAHAAPPAQSLAARLGTLWTQLTHLFAPTTGQAGQGKGLAAEGGSCIDPNGCTPLAQLLRR
jgi:hypothetical protein